MSVPKIAQKSPYEITTQEGQKVAWCSCGHSEKQPFCDGAHKGSGYKPVQFKAEKTESVFLCACKQTHTQPYCDKTHIKVAMGAAKDKLKSFFN